MSTSVTQEPRLARHAADATTFSIILALSFSHFLNDMIQSLVPSLYPMLKGSYGLSFSQIGLITLTMQVTSSLLQPAVGAFADRRPQPYSLPAGMGVTLAGLLLLANADSFPLLLLAAGMVGAGSAVFHPEASRVARMASGGRHGLAQSLFQVGGNVGSATGPILAAFIVIPRGQGSISWFSGAALLAMAVLVAVGNWHWRERAAPARGSAAVRRRAARPCRGGRSAGRSRSCLALIFSKSFYTDQPQQLLHLLPDPQVRRCRSSSAQIYLFVFLAAVALGTLIGGPVGDRIGRKAVIWGSILGVIPFTLALPYVGLYWTASADRVIGLTLASASSRDHRLRDRPGARQGRHDLGAVLRPVVRARPASARRCSAVWPTLTSIDFVYQVCAFLPLLGLLTVFLPDVGRPAAEAAADRAIGEARATRHPQHLMTIVRR